MNAQTPIAAKPLTSFEAELVKTLADYTAEAEARQAGHGFSYGALGGATDEQLARADLQIEMLSNPDCKRAAQDAFYEKYGLRRGDDLRPVPPVTAVVREIDERALELWTKHRWSEEDWAYANSRSADHLEAGI